MNAFANAAKTVEFTAEAPYTELLLGSGSNRDRKVYHAADKKKPFKNLVTLDIEATHNPDVVHDLNVMPWPFADNSFDEVHAYEVLEHLGKQGDAKSFFAHFSEIWRILKPDGCLYASCPMWDSPWAWGDPSHTRIITKHSLVFLSQEEYAKQVGITAMSDFRSLYKANFEILATQEESDILAFVLKAVK